MLRDTSIVYDLCTQLKEYRYINHYSDEILTKSQEERINCNQQIFMQHF